MTTELGDTVSDSGDGSHAAEAYCAACNQSFSPETEKCPNDGSKLVRFDAQKDAMIGRVLDDRFEVRQPLGKGGMGTVYRALQVSVDREVAIKVVHPKLANDRQAAKRFLREARLASRLNQPNIVNVIEFGQTTDGVLYLVMELLRGRTLAAELGGQRRLSVRRTATIALQLCDALEAAHAQGIVHRDLKPGNIVILDDPPGRDLLKVLDFGLAKSLITDTTSQVTNTNAIIGTPLYMSPEQVQGKPSDQRGDLYSLGCILFELLAGTPPFTDSSVNLILAKHISDPPPPLPAHVPAPMRQLVERLLAKDPEARVQTAGEARVAIQAVIEGGALAAPAEPPSDTVPDIPIEYAATADVSAGAAAPARTPGATPASPIAHAPTPATGQIPPARSRAPLLAAVAIVAIVGGVAAVLIAQRGDDRDAPATGAAPPDLPAITDAAIAVPEATPDAAPPPAAIDAAVAAAPPAVDAARPGRDARQRTPRDARTVAPVTTMDARPRTLPPPPVRKVDAEPDVDFYPAK